MIGFRMLSTHIKNNKNINWCYTLFAGILNGGDYSPGSGNLVVKSIDGAQSRRSWLGKDKIWVVKHDQWEETSSNLPSLAVPKKMAKIHEKKVQPRTFREGDLVLRKVLPLPNEDHGK